MKCSKCGALLSPFILKQVHRKEGSLEETNKRKRLFRRWRKKHNNRLLFEIECPNPHCRFLSIISENFYFFLKKDALHKPEIPPELTNKLPGEANVIFNSLDRTGISWVVRRLDWLHKEMFGSDIDYSPEISRVIATRKRFPLPQGWYNVYECNPQDLLDRGYDKVISIQRPLRIMYRVLSMYYKPELSYKECREKHPNYFKTIDKYYDIVYGKVDEIDDNRFLNIKLSGLNNRTEANFHKLMDFLNYPKENRPGIFPVNPTNRNWQAYSTTLGENEPIGTKLRQMRDDFGDIFGKEEKDVILFLEDLDKVLKKWETEKEIRIRARLMEIQNRLDYGLLEVDIQKNIIANNMLENFPPAKFRKPQKVPKVIPFEKEVQNDRKFRLYFEDIDDALEKDQKYYILVLGPIGYGYGCHMSEVLTEGFLNLNHRVVFINQRLLAEKNMREPQKVSVIIEKLLNNRKPDFIFLSEMRIRIINDLGIPMHYFHTGWYMAPNVEGDHIVHYFRQSQIVDAYRKEGRIVDTMYSAVDPNHFYPEPKILDGVCGIGFRKGWEKWFSVVGSLKPLVRLMKKETDYFISLGHKYFPTPVDDLQYREILRKIEALNPLTANGGYITRRMLEGMACKTLIIMRLDFALRDGKKDSSVHRTMLREMGYYAGEHYIEIENAKDIKEVWRNTTEEQKDRIRENAYKLTLERHAPINRAKRIIEDFESGKWKEAKYYPETKKDAERRENAKQARIKETKEIEEVVTK